MSNAVIDEAMSWLGTPYHHKAAIKGVGVDCAWLLIEVFHAAKGIERPDVESYPPDWHLHRSEEIYLQWIEQYCEPIETPEPGDIAMFQFGRTQSHGAIVVEWPQIIHSYRGRGRGKGVILDDGTQGDMAGRLRGFWRVK